MERADGLSLVLNAPTEAESVLNRNLVINPGAEAGSASTSGGIAVDVPGWTRTTPFSVERYDPRGRFRSTMPGSANRGAALFTAGEDSDVSSGVPSIQLGPVTPADRGGEAKLLPRTYAWRSAAFFNPVVLRFQCATRVRGKKATFFEAAISTQPTD